ncbi:hypothetical protein ACFQX6_25240 [Streptosporangium lutulentum]
MSPTIRHAALAAAAVAATFALTPTAHATASPSRYTCANGPFESENEGDAIGTDCGVDDTGAPNQIHFSTYGSTYVCEAVEPQPPPKTGRSR